MLGLANAHARALTDYPRDTRLVAAARAVEFYISDLPQGLEIACVDGSAPALYALSNLTLSLSLIPYKPLRCNQTWAGFLRNPRPRPRHRRCEY